MPSLIMFERYVNFELHQTMTSRAINHTSFERYVNFELHQTYIKLHFLTIGLRDM